MVVPEVPTTISPETYELAFHQAFIVSFICDVFLILIGLATVEAIRDVRANRKANKVNSASVTATHRIPVSDCE